MNNSLTIQTVINEKEKYNLAIPFTESVQVNPYFKVSVSLLQVDTSEQAAQIFKVGKSESGELLYSLTKPFLQRLATQAGIQFAPGSGDVVKMDQNTWKANAFGAIKLPDGSVRTSSNFKVIDLLTEERKYRLSYEEKSVEGVVGYPAAKNASQRYKGEMIDTGEKNKNGYPVQKFVVAEEEREKFIERSLLEAMAQLRANAPQKAATGAILRVIRDLTGVKGTYTKEELKKPFAVARISFSPDFSDPEIKQMMLVQGMNSIGSMFGTPQMTMMSTLPAPNVIDQDFNPEEFADNPAFAPDSAFAPDGKEEESNWFDQEQGQAESPIEKPPKQVEDRSQDFCCDKCGAVIPQKVWDYSIEKYGRPLCYTHQREAGKE